MTLRALRDGIALVLGAFLSAAHPGAAQAGDGDALAELLAAGRYSEAYELALRDAPAPHTDAVAGFARALLATSMQGQDSYARWFALRAARPLTDASLAEAARTAAHQADPYEQSLALDILARVDPSGSRADFVVALDSPFRSVRLRALRALGKRKDSTLIQRFGDVLSKDSDPDLRALAARALGDTGSGQAIPVLYGGLHDQAAIVQEEAVRALVALRDPQIAGVVRQQLSEAAPEAKPRVIRLVALVPAPELIDDLTPLLTDGDSEVRTFAAAAILSILERTEARRR